MRVIVVTDAVVDPWTDSTVSEHHYWGSNSLPVMIYER